VNAALKKRGHTGSHDIATGELIADELATFTGPLRLRGHSWQAVRDHLRDACDETPSVQWLINELPELNRPAHELAASDA
jgi:hypothetical protein